MNISTDSLLTQGFVLATAQLRHFASQSDFIEQLGIAFGANFDRAVAIDLANLFQAGDFSLLPKIKVLSNGELGSANGAYAGESDQILVSSEFLEQMEGDVNAVAELFIEEIGHKLDFLLNGTVDSPGDEGAIFLLLVTGHPLSEDTLASLRAANDRVFVTVDGESIAVETQDFWANKIGGDKNERENDAAFGDFVDWFFT
jgi:hypothetical protein